MTQRTIDQAMQMAIQNHQAGRLTEAEELYRQILARQPNHPDALHLLGVVAHQAGQADHAVELIRRAIRINPAVADYHINLGSALRMTGAMEESAAAYREAIRLKPDYAEAYSNLGHVLHQKGMIDEAMIACRQAIQLKPELAPAHFNLGCCLFARGQADEAIASLREAIRIHPNYLDAYNALGGVLREKRNLDEAAAVLQEALRRGPDNAFAWNNLGNVFRDKSELDEAVAAFERAIQLRPNQAEFYNNLANTLSDKGLVDQAIAKLKESIRLNPHFAEAHFGLAAALLLKGNFAEGWPEAEWRSRCKRFAHQSRKYEQPRWDGQPLDGRTILLWSDAGMGDAILFARYVPMVARLGGKVILESPPELVRLFRGLSGVEQIISSGETPQKFDLHCPLFGMPLAFKTTLDSIPAEIPYLTADRDLSVQWKTRLKDSDRIKIGVAWAGNPRNQTDIKRAVSLQQFAPLAAIPGITFHSLQKGAAAGQAANPPAGMKLVDHTADLNDFAETAALIDNLDLVIAVESAVAHLAGAMGKATWVMVPLAPDWRWLLDREDSPWFPTMRLFRQKTVGSWTEVFERLAKSLDEFVQT